MYTFCRDYSASTQSIGYISVSSNDRHEGLRLTRKAFTLTEMLIVLLLAGLLLGLVLPVLGRSRSQAVRAQCASNLRQIALLRAGNPETDRWGNSPYDVGDSSDTGWNRSDNGKSLWGDGDADGDLDSDDEEYYFDERAETQAVDLPLGWTLVCSPADRMSLNSFGIRYDVRYSPYEHVTSLDVVLGCSDYKVVDVVSHFALRHENSANFLFGDLHVASNGLEIFTAEEVAARSKRSPATPIRRIGLGKGN